MLSAGRVSSTPIADHRILLLGAGSAAVGVAGYLHTALIEAGLSADEADARIALVDLGGLLHQGRADLSETQRRFARPEADAAAWSSDAHAAADLASVVARFRPTVLIGLSTAGGAFTRANRAADGDDADRPVILPLSNPSSRSEADPQDVLTWTDGRALIATGSRTPRRPRRTAPSRSRSATTPTSSRPWD